MRKASMLVSLFTLLVVLLPQPQTSPFAVAAAPKVETVLYQADWSHGLKGWGPISILAHVGAVGHNVLVGRQLFRNAINAAFDLAYIDSACVDRLYPGKSVDHDRQTFLLSNHPDVYLWNVIAEKGTGNPSKVTYATNSFAVTSQFIDENGGGYYGFMVLLKGGNSTYAKNMFIQWLHAVCLTDTQIEHLHIKYVSPSHSPVMNVKLTPFQRTLPGITTESKIEKFPGIISKNVLPNGERLYKLKSVNALIPDEIIAHIGVAIFERVSTYTSNRGGLPKISHYVSIYGKPLEKSSGNATYGPQANSLLYTTKGFVITGNTITDETYEILVFIPMPVSEFKRIYGRYIRPFGQTSP